MTQKQKGNGTKPKGKWHKAKREMTQNQKGNDSKEKGNE